MALPSTGPISMSQIAGEFGGSTPHSLSEYYGAASGIPSSGTISMSQFRGKSNNVPLTLTYLIIAGGGRAPHDGGTSHVAPGGAGGLLEGTVSTATNRPGTISVAKAILGGTTKANGNNSNLTNADMNLTAIGGGSGGLRSGTYDTAKGEDGGSGGGGHDWTNSTVSYDNGGKGTANQGNDGKPYYSGRGGGPGGAGGAGGGGYTTGGGGPGKLSSITGTEVEYAKGGQAGGTPGSPDPGTTGVYGSGGNGNADRTATAPERGVIILRLSNQFKITYSGVLGVKTTVGSDVVYTFTWNGSTTGSWNIEQA